MIPNVNKGGDMKGLLRYLADVRSEFRDGKRNVHVNPHVVGGDSYLMAMYESNVLGSKDAHDIASYLDQPRVVYGTQIMSKVWTQDENGNRVPVMETDAETGRTVQLQRDQHVWHCSLSLSRDDGSLSNEEWDSITRDFMDRMEFTDASGKSPARWVAIHHGATKDGLDHVHIAASMVREDGTRWSGRYGDFRRAQEVARELERKYRLTVVAGREFGTAERGIKAAEQATADRLGLRTTLRRELADRVRSAAVASTSEAEWVRRVRDNGMVIKPYFAAGTNDVVSGYRVALRPADANDRLLFHGGQKLAQDLSLPRIRENWPTPTIDQAQEASDEWQAAFRGRPPVRRDGRETKQPATTAPDVAARNFAAFNRRLGGIPISDRMAWSDAARDVSGALSSWARFDPEHADDLRSAAAVLARSAQERRAGTVPGRRVKESPMGTAYLFLGMKRPDKPRIAGAVLMRQVLKTAEALRDYHAQTKNTHQALAIERDVIARLNAIPLTGYAPAPPELSRQEERAARAAHEVAQGHTTTAGAAVPNAVTPRPPTPARTTTGARTKEQRDGR